MSLKILSKKQKEEIEKNEIKPKKETKKQVTNEKNKIEATVTKRSFYKEGTLKN